MSNKIANIKGLLHEIPESKRIQLLGEITSILLCSDLHRRYRVNDIGSVFLPAIHYNQFKIYKKGNTPVGIITWAFLSDEIEKKYITGKYFLQLEDWKSGNNGWVVDFAAPFGDAKQIIRDIRNNVFPDRVGKAIRMTPQGKIKSIYTLRGIRAKKNNT